MSRTRRARLPFRFSDYEGLVIVTGVEASNLREFLDRIRVVSTEVLHHQLLRSVLDHRFGPRSYPNAFAEWAAVGLGDPALAEKLSTLDPYADDSLERTRDRIVEIVEDHLDTLVTVPWARPGFEHHFAAGHFIALPTERRAWTLAGLRRGIAAVPLSSIYFHVHDAQLRATDRIDDFSRWTADELEQPDVAGRMRGLDTRLLGLEEYRRQLVAILESTPAGA